MNTKTTKKPKTDRQPKVDPKKQIADRVAAALAPKKNEVKKVYKPGSPGEARNRLGVTLTQLKLAINEPTNKVTVSLDENGNPIEVIGSEMVRVSAHCTKRRRKYVARNLLGASNRKRRTWRGAAVNSKGTKLPKKSVAKQVAKAGAK